MNKIAIKTIVAIGIGSAVFSVLAFVSIPTPIPNTYIQLSYGFLSLIGLIFGPITALFVGLIGHTLKDSLSGSPWWSWIIASAVCGLVMGYSKNRTKANEGKFDTKDIIIFNVIQIVANAVAWFVVAPILDILIYAEPINKVFVQGAVAGVANMVTVGILGTILAIAYAKTIPKKGSLTKQ